MQNPRHHFTRHEVVAGGSSGSKSSMFTIGLLAIGAIPTTIGVGQAISAQKKQNAAQKEQAKFHLTAKLSLGGRPPMEAMIVLKDNKVS